jgi:hypothetical protein
LRLGVSTDESDAAVSVDLAIRFEEEQAKAEADPYGMTNKGTNNGKGKGNGKDNRRSPARMTNKRTER